MAVDPEGISKEKANSKKSFFLRAIGSILSTLLKFIISLVALAIIVVYLGVFVYVLLGKRFLYDEIWMGMANQYQELPEDRMRKVNLDEPKLLFWDKVNFNSLHLRTINGIETNPYFNVKKLNGEADINDFSNDCHMIQVEGKYAMEMMKVVRRKGLETRLVFEPKKTKDIRLKYNIDDKILVDLLKYPDQYDDNENRDIRREKNKPAFLNEEDREIYSNFLKIQVAQSKAAYFPFIINIPLELDTRDKIRINDRDEVDREWFYFEVEIIKRIGLNMDFIVGLLPFPYGSSTKLDEIDNMLSGKEVKQLPNGEVDEKYFFGIENAVELDQPEWVKKHFLKTGLGNDDIAKGVKPITEWKNIRPGEMQDSIGFNVADGKLKISGGIEWIVDMREYLDQIYDPDSLFKTRLPKRTMAQLDEDKAKKFQDEDDEGAHHIGDCFGVALNLKTGYLFLTYNGTIMNTPEQNVNTQVNMAIRQMFAEEEKEFNAKVVMEEMKKNPKYFNKLSLKPEIKRRLDPKELIKVNTSVKYIPAVYCDQNTSFRVNFGASPFRNQQPDFQSGILSNFDEELHEHMERL